MVPLFDLAPGNKYNYHRSDIHFEQRRSEGTVFFWAFSQINIEWGHENAVIEKQV